MKDFKNIITISPSNYYGDVGILKRGDNYYLTLENYNTINGRKITKEIYDLLEELPRLPKFSDIILGDS